MEIMKKLVSAIVVVSIVLGCANIASAQTDIHISGPRGGFPVAIPKLCFSSVGASESEKISNQISKNLDISGLFKVVNPNSFVESASKCSQPKEIAYSDWSVIGAEGVVKGVVSPAEGGQIAVEMLLFDVQQQKPVLGKRYTAPASDTKKIGDRFSNEIIKYFTGDLGIFGSQIAYVSKVGRFKELFVMDIDGSNPRKLTQDKGLAITPSWSPSGDRIVYTSYRTRKPELYFISPEGGEPQRVTRLDGLEIGAEFSRSGREIVTSASMLGSPNIVLMDLRGKLLRKITSSSAIDVSPSWSPDNSKVVFCSNRGGGPQIYITSAEGGSGNARRISFTGSKYCTSPSWSPNGDKIAFVCRNKGNQIYVSDADGSNTSQLTFSGDNEDPSWSPDGKFLVFSSDFGKRGPRNIALMPLATAQPRQISFSRSEDGQPAWSPRF